MLLKITLDIFISIFYNIRHKEILMQVNVRNNNVEAALRIFRKKSADILWDVRQREHYEKPTTRRKTAKKAAIKREQKRKQM